MFFIILKTLELKAGVLSSYCAKCLKFPLTSKECDIYAPSASFSALSRYVTKKKKKF